MKIILTGGAGFLGSHTAVELVNEGYEPIIIDDFRNSKSFIIENIEKIIGKKVVFYCADVGSQNKVSSIIKKETPSKRFLLFSNKYLIYPLIKVPSPAPNSIRANF